MYIDAGFLGQKPAFSVCVLFAIASNHMDFMAGSHHTPCHFVGTGTAGHFWCIKILMQVYNFHLTTLDEACLKKFLFRSWTVNVLKAGKTKPNRKAAFKTQKKVAISLRILHAIYPPACIYLGKP